jgi:fructose-1-phosphate kinase PfkB-like protein
MVPFYVKDRSYRVELICDPLPEQPVSHTNRILVKVYHEPALKEYRIMAFPTQVERKELDGIPYEVANVTKFRDCIAILGKTPRYSDKQLHDVVARSIRSGAVLDCVEQACNRNGLVLSAGMIEKVAPSVLA